MWWKGGGGGGYDVIFNITEGGLELIFFVLEGGGLSKFLLDNSSFSAPPPDNYCTVPKGTTECSISKIARKADQEKLLENYGAPYWTLLQTFDICAKLQFDMLIVI